MFWSTPLLRDASLENRPLMILAQLTLDSIINETGLE